MKAYMVAPPFETFGNDGERTSAAIDLITDIVFESLRRGGDTFQFAVAWANPGEAPGGIWNDDIAVPHVTCLDSDAALRHWLRTSVYPNTPGGGDVRSIATCRTATFGYDGQALLCLRHEDPPPVSSDTSLAIVEERSDLLVDSDWFDGWIRSDGAGDGGC